MKNKLLLIEESIKDKVDSLNQKENFKVGYNFLIEQSNIDSAKKYLNNSKKIKYSNQLNQIINDYINNLNIINYNEIKDSLKINNFLLIHDLHYQQKLFPHPRFHMILN